jgi:hypothetical protein
MATETLERPITVRQAWDAALKNWRKAEAAADRICEACDIADKPLSKHLEDERERLVSEASDLQTVMMQTPAPDGTALLEKLEFLLRLDDKGSIDPWTGLIVTPAMQDARRLLAPPPARQRLEESLERLAQMDGLIVHLQTLHRAAINDLLILQDHGVIAAGLTCLGDAMATIDMAEEKTAELARLTEGRVCRAGWRRAL